LPQPIILWHFLQAQKSLEKAAAEKNDEQNLLILLLNPELYDAMNKRSNDELIENMYFVEQEDEEGRISSTMTEEEFKALARERRLLRQNEVMVSQTIAGEEILHNQVPNQNFDYPMNVESM